MREYKFRGKDIKGDWYYGNLAILSKDLKANCTCIDAGYYISNSVGMPFAYAVRPETVGQYTGLKDKNGKEIWENDIMKMADSNWGYGGDYDKRNDGYIRYVVPSIAEMLKGEFECKYGSQYSMSVETEYLQGHEVIGNIHDNHELIERWRVKC